MYFQVWTGKARIGLVMPGYFMLDYVSLVSPIYPGKEMLRQVRSGEIKFIHIRTG